MGISEVISAPKSPCQNPCVTKIFGAFGREYLDHVIVLPNFFSGSPKSANNYYFNLFADSMIDIDIIRKQLFYFKYIEPNEQIISESNSSRLFETLTRKGFDSWLGFAFERFCLKNASLLAQVMEFDQDMLLAAPYFGRNDRHFQIDLLFKRADHVITVCAVKHQNSKIGTKVIPEMERKCALLKTPRGYVMEKALISLYGPDNALRDSAYFNHFVTLEDLFPDR